MLVIGDPHLGRRFKTGVPLHRMGEREADMMEDFTTRLRCAEEDVLIIGDLFDKFVVPPEIVLEAYNACLNCNHEVYVLQGNHDASKDDAKASSFDIFSTLVENSENVTAISKPMVINGEGFIPHDIFTPIVDQINQLPAGITHIYTHHDFVDFGGDHVLPTKLLAEKGILNVTNGHDHLARVEERHGVTVKMVGSMQPYTHAEDTKGLYYVTVPLDELDPDEVRFKNVRVLLKPGETLPTDIDCLSLTAKRVEDLEAEEVGTVDVENFNLRQLLAEALEGLPVAEEVMGEFE